MHTGSTKILHVYMASAGTDKNIIQGSYSLTMRLPINRQQPFPVGRLSSQFQWTVFNPRSLG